MVEVSWAAIGAGCALIMAGLAIFGFWMRFSDRITKAETSAQGASIAIAASQIKIENLQKELSDYKTQAASMFVSDKELFNAEQRFSGLVEEIKRDIRGVTERLDRVLEGAGHSPART
ncbi:MAG: hypothetical protein V4477_16695 [Pseudomonadota bacterium]